MYTAQAFLALTSRQRNRPGEGRRAGSASGPEARRARTSRALAHHGGDVLNCRQSIAALSRACEAACQIVLSHPEKSLQFAVAAGLQRRYRQDRGHGILLCCPRGPDHRGRMRSRGHNQQQTAPAWAAGANKGQKREIQPRSFDSEGCETSEISGKDSGRTKSVNTQVCSHER